MHIQLQRDSHSFSMTDLVFVAGLYLLEPAALITAQVAGVGPGPGAAPPPVRHEAGVQPRRSTPSRAAWPRSSSAPSAAPRSLAGAWDWVAALAAVAVSTFTACACIYAVMRVSEASLTLRELPRMLALSLPFALGVAAVGLLAAETAAQNPASLVLLALPSGLLIAAYRAYAKAREQQNNLRLLHEITSLLYNSDDAPTALTDFLTAVRGAFRAELGRAGALR